MWNKVCVGPEHSFPVFSLWIQILILYMFTNHKILLNFSVQSFYQGFIIVA